MQNDFTPYVFISYTKEQFNSPSSSNSDTNDNDNSATSQNMADLYADCIGAATFYANQSGSNPEQYAFWLDEECQPMRYTDDDTNEIEVSDAAAQQRLADRDVRIVFETGHGGSAKSPELLLNSLVVFSVLGIHDERCHPWRRINHYHHSHN